MLLFYHNCVPYLLTFFNVITFNKMIHSLISQYPPLLLPICLTFSIDRICLCIVLGATFNTIAILCVVILLSWRIKEMISSSRAFLGTFACSSLSAFSTYYYVIKLPVLRLVHKPLMCKYIYVPICHRFTHSINPPVRDTYCYIPHIASEAPDGFRCQ